MTLLLNWTSLTHLNDPLVCAVGAKVCEIVAREDVCAVARSKGGMFKAGLEQVGQAASLQ